MELLKKNSTSCTARKHGILWILVDPGFVFDALRSGSIAERAQSLVKVVIDRTDTGTHHRLGVAT